MEMQEYVKKEDNKIDLKSHSFKLLSPRNSQGYKHRALENSLFVSYIDRAGIIIHVVHLICLFS